MANDPTIKISSPGPPTPPKSARESDQESGSPTPEIDKQRGAKVSQEELDQLNSDCRNLWDRKMRDFGFTTSNYVKVAVYLISWDAPFDDLNTKDEVDQLAKVFKEKYNFEVSFLKLAEKPRKKTQAHLMHKLSGFVCDNDDEDTLLIIYYAGHGFVRDDSPGEVELTGWRAPSQSKSANKVLWNNVETVLEEQYCTCDVLEIMDCCYAGDLGEPKRGRSDWCNRNFEFIAAASAGHETNSPGKTSFTTALIWALDHFALPDTRDNFIVTDLVKKVRECPDFPKEQVPYSSPRNIGKYERMVLAPLPTDEEAIEARKKASRDAGPLSSRYNLHLDFDFNELPSLKDIDLLANQLKHVRRRGIDVSRISWNGLGSALTPLAQEAVSRFKQAVRDRKKSEASQASSPVSRVMTMDIHIVPDSKPTAASASSQQSGTQNASYHLQMLLTITWATIICIVASMTERVKIALLIVAALVGFVTVFSILAGGEASEL